MSSASLIRWSGGALLLAGAILGVSTLLHPNEVADPEAVLSGAWVIVHTAYVPGFVLALFGLAGLYARLAERGGKLGLAGFVLSFIGSALFLVVVVTEAAIVPAVAASDAGPTLLDPTGPLFGGELGLIFLVGQITFALGFVLTGIATARAGVLPRSAGLLLFGAPLVAFWPPLPQLVGVAGGVLFGFGFVWLGYAVWSGAGAVRQEGGEGAPAHV
jgi:hypothetical protein